MSFRCFCRRDLIMMSDRLPRPAERRVGGAAHIGEILVQQPERLIAVLYEFNAIEEASPQADHGLVSRDQMLLRAVEHWSHRERHNGVLLFDAAEPAPVALHGRSILSEMVPPGPLEI